MLQIRRHINDLMTSNSYVLSDPKSRCCMIVDPGSEKSEEIIRYISENDFIPEYIILTHEHSDHTWGVNALLDKYPNIKVIASQACKDALPRAVQAYFRYYYSDPTYVYHVRRVDVTVEELNNQLQWHDYTIRFIATPGHSYGSICFIIDNNFFSGDTVMQTKPYINKRDGNVELYKKSIALLKQTIPDTMNVYPGHGDQFMFMENSLSNRLID